MESKQNSQTESQNNQTFIDSEKLSSHLADIELKLDHLIEELTDSLYRLKKSDLENQEGLE